MEYVLSSEKLLIHAREDWPCALCRLGDASERSGLWLCLHCAQNVILQVEAGVEGSRELLDEVADALVFIAARRAESQPFAD